MRAKKHLGQHFLRDNLVIDKILDSIYKDCPVDMHVLEVGPGEGVLTHDLAARYPSFRAIEFDRDMVALLTKTIDTDKIIQADFLGSDLEVLFSGEPFALVGNFPYNISSQIIFKMLDNLDLVPIMIGMFQKEVGDRICATPGTKKNGIISLRAQAFYTAESLFDIGPDAFSPPPKVQSSVIKLTRKADTTLGCDAKIFQHIIKASFGQRRKKLRNTLKSFLDDTSDEVFQQRPEQLGVEDFINIAQLIEKQKQ